MAEPRPALRALSARLGIEPELRSPLSDETIQVSAGTHEALIAAMGFDGSSEKSAADGLAELDARPLPAPLEGADCSDVDSILAGRGVFGLWANLYSLRSERDVGFGTFTELSLLVEEAADAGAGFVGINPLHALASSDHMACPYFPESRFYRSPLYLDLSRLAERLGVPPPPLPATPARSHIDPAGRQRSLEVPLRQLHAAFQTSQGAAAEDGRRSFEAWRAEQGEALERYATYCALADQLGGPRDWRRWPARLQQPAEPAVEAFRRERAAEVTHHAWIQFQILRQLEEVSDLARRRGLPMGLYADLALGSAPGGADTWAWPELFATGATVGAPPDAFSLEGQDWGLPPLDPHALRASGYAFFERLLDANLVHVGALRIDHALGLRRLFWIPEGASPAAGAYVRQPEADLFALIGRASQRHGVVIIAEDLGNVPPGFSEELQGRGMLSSRVLLFERDESGYRASSEYPRRCLATLDTHDLPPLAAWLSDSDLPLRLEAGQIPDSRALEQVREERVAERTLLAARLRREGCAPEPEDDPVAWAEATTRFLASTPAAAIGIGLDDLAGETEPINLPGVASERHPSWLRRSTRTLEDIFRSPETRRILGAIPANRRVTRRVTRR